MLGGHPIVLASPICWGLHCNWTAPSPIASFGLFFRTMTMTQDATPQPLSMSPLILFMQPNQISHGSCLHINKFCYQLEMQSWPTLNHCFYVLTLRKYFPFVSQLVLQPQKTSIDCPSKAKVSLSDAVLLLQPTLQLQLCRNHTFLIKIYYTNDPTVFDPSETSQVRSYHLQFFSTYFPSSHSPLNV